MTDAETELGVLLLEAEEGLFEVVAGEECWIESGERSEVKRRLS